MKNFPDKPRPHAARAIRRSQGLEQAGKQKTSALFRANLLIFEQMRRANLEYGLLVQFVEAGWGASSAATAAEIRSLLDDR
jgi:hypothetical protein